MKKSIPIIRERESEAFILGNGREREFPLTPALGRIKLRGGGGGGGGKSATVKNEVFFNGFTESTSLVQFKSCVL